MYTYERLRRLAIQSGVPDNKVSIGFWIKSKGLKKIKKQDVYKRQLQTSHNRHDFNYDNYLQHQGIQAKGFPAGEIHKTGHSRDLYSVCHTIRNDLVAKLQRVIPDCTAYKLLAALCQMCIRDRLPLNSLRRKVDTPVPHKLPEMVYVIL